MKSCYKMKNKKRYFQLGYYIHLWGTKDKSLYHLTRNNKTYLRPFKNKLDICWKYIS